ncbi:hypothetical protein SmJEL517_g04980 [Synchytrium microbalum]|uniref:SAM-dependent MTase RsmB/NOP-type domain-containing protein n=1 Tax=Synchytrium microbalum TaxID=1806994 RepID=A0A507BY50_9FUNG|nr:uncharacterized protein SmJEL517_g04980 [Synchytrium microbalum]TPX31789.1 hypothetical protein SmJEL517_g04980 [Synchytrium microbalum]
MSATKHHASQGSVATTSNNVYQTASDIIVKLDEKAGTIKSLVYKTAESVDKKRLYGLICETLKYREALTHVIEQAALLKQERKMSRELALVLSHDLLIGNGVSGRFKAIMAKHKSRMQSEFIKLKVRRKAKLNSDLIPERMKVADLIPRYVRVNTLKTTLKAVLDSLSKTYGLVLASETHLATNKKKLMTIDPHIPNLLVLPHGTDLHLDEMVIQGNMILQDKASCFPAFLLNPKPGSIVIDACAAPGNKTSHLSMLMQNKGTIHAFDMDPRRLKLLKNRMTQAGCSNVMTHLGSFLEATPASLGHVDCILLDPSCSGSGMLNPLESSEDDETEEMTATTADRLQSLSTFQLSLLNHALSFETVKRVAYSTCSIHQQENEDVVRKALQQNGKKWRLQEEVLSTWKRRGLPVFDGAEKVIRVSSAEDLACGFFVAVFERI